MKKLGKLISVFAGIIAVVGVIAVVSQLGRKKELEERNYISIE